MSRTRRLHVLALAAIVALFLAGCSSAQTLDDEQVEGIIADQVCEHLSACSVTVDCPTDVKAQEGGEFTCDVVDDSGASLGPATVTQTDDQGNVDVSFTGDPPLLAVGTVESSAADAICQQADVCSASVDCPGPIAVEVGSEFVCDVLDESAAVIGTVSVTQTDDQGNVDIEFVLD